MFSKNQIILLLISAVTLLLSGYLFWVGLNPSQERKETDQTDQVKLEPPQGIPLEEVKVLRVIDGDTIEVSHQNQTKKLRYIGIDTPETSDPRKEVECFGKEASLENKRLVEGKMVFLEKDVSETDKYGRLLRYVYLKLSDGSILFINDYLVRQGFAHASTYPPDVKFQDQFIEAQREARENNRGLWSGCNKF